MISSALERQILIDGVTPYTPPVYTASRVLYTDGSGVPTTNGYLTVVPASSRLVIAQGGQALDGNALSPQLLIGGDSPSPGTITLDGYGQQPALNMRRAGGTQASKSAVLSTQAGFQLQSLLWDGSAYTLGGYLRMVANGNISGSNIGQDFTINLTANGSISAPSVKARFIGQGEGGLGIGTEGLVTIDTALVIRRANPPDIGYVARFISNLTAYVYIQSGTGANEQAGFALKQNTNGKEWRFAVIGNDNNAFRIAGGNGGTDIKATVTQNGNLIIADSNLDPATGSMCLVFGDGVAPSSLDSNSAALYANDVSGTVNIFAINEAGESNQLSGDIKIASGKYFYTNAAAFMLRGVVSYTDGAGALTGTLTNSPVTGNPTKWIPIDDNGVTRYIPAW